VCAAASKVANTHGLAFEKALREAGSRVLGANWLAKAAT
jgi:hypothetical protein